MSSNKVRFSSPLLFAFLWIMPMAALKAQQIAELKGMSSRSANDLPHIRVLLMLPGQETPARAADALAAYFSSDFSNAIGDEDSYKLANPEENMGILRNGKTLCIEGRKPVAGLDTLPLKIWKLHKTSYLLKADVTHFSGASVYLHDSYLNSDTKLDDGASTTVSFTIGNDAASAAPERFSVVLKTYSTYSTLPVQLTSIKANEKNKGVEVTWNAENESNIDRYEVEQSSNGQVFATVGTTRPNNNPGISASYSWLDAAQLNGDKYYRVKSLDRSGEIKYSPVVKVQVRNAASHISATNPGAGNAITLFLTNSAKGNYKLSLVNYSGQTFYSGNISHDGGTTSHMVGINHSVPAGIYQLLVVHNDTKQNFPLLFQ